MLKEHMPEDIANNFLEVRGLSICINQGKQKRLLVDDLNFQIKKGRFIALMGRSGIGKSLAIKAILGLLNDQRWELEGDIVFYQDSEEIFILREGRYNKEALSRLIGRSIVSIFQGSDSHLHPSLTIGWQIGETIDSLRPWRNAREVENRLDRVKLGAEKLKCYPHQLSQGQRQRAAIAMALSQPKIIIADEITTALDEKNRKSIARLLANLRQERKIDSLLFVTHDLKAVRELFEADDVLLVMDEEGESGTRIVESVKFKEINVSSGKKHPLLIQEGVNRRKRINKEQEALPAEPILLINGLRQHYYHGILTIKAKVIINGLDLKVKAGEFFGVRGNSGCGKTTLVKSIARLLNHSQGSIFFRSEKYGWCDLIKLQPNGLKSDCLKMREIRKEIQVIFQDSASIFNPKMTIRELLSETLEIAGIVGFAEQINRMKTALFKFGICNDDKEVEEVLNKYPGELSGGEKQRLAILRALLLNPRLIIADEPFTDQDKITKQEIIRMMDKARKEDGITFIIISHELDLLSNICDRTAIMHEGKVVKVTHRFKNKDYAEKICFA